MTPLLLLVLLLVPQAADTLRLDRAYHAAETRFARTREVALADRTLELRERNLDARYLPTLTASSQATYVSDVAEIGISMPGFSPPAIAKDQYKAGITAEQLVYDGGTIAAQRALERVQARWAAGEVAVAAYALRSEVHAAWFAALAAEAEAAVLSVLEGELAARRDQVQAAFARGAATRAQADVFEAERLRVVQQRTGAEARRRGALDALAELTGWTLPDEVRLELEAGPAGSGAEPRPEFRLFALSRERLDAQSRLLERRSHPKVGAFADVAVGRPQGMNFFENDLGPFFSVGIKATWTPWDWHSTDRDREVVALQAESVDAQEEAFRQALLVRRSRLLQDVAALERQLEGDAELIALRTRITADAASRLGNGTITATEFLVERGNQERAELAERQRRIQLAQARAALELLNPNDR